NQNNSIEKKLYCKKINDTLHDLLPSEKFNRNNNFFEERHGIISARILLCSLINRFNNNSWNFKAKESIKAIMLHTEDGDISLIKDPLSALLLICDELQEWDRPYSYYSSNWEKGLDHLDIEIIENKPNSKNKFQINYKYPIDANISNKNKIERNLKRLKGIKMKNID
ncbi:MAG: hypothetical protein ACFFKA_20670, partial [Candidatus Thorarchaeota archaeon]